MNKEPPFWMVLGTGTPRHRHDTEQSARNEAERLAKANPGEDFFVLRPIAKVRTFRPIEWSDFATDEIPF